MSVYAEMISRVKVQMGTFVSISVDEKDKRFLEDGFKIIEKVEYSLSSFDKTAQIYLLNTNRFIKPDTYTYEALKLSQEYYKKTDGYFDISIGSITKKIYRFADQPRLPKEGELEMARVDLRGLDLNRSQARLSCGITIDLGGMGKGFAVDKVTEYFKEHNVTRAVVAASGDIRCLQSCKIEINNPFSNSPLASFHTLQGESGVSTSGNYNRYVASVQNNHLIDPKAKQSQQTFVSITLIAKLPNSDWDAYATAASVMPKEKAYSFLDALDVAYIVLESNARLKTSKNISNYTQDLLIYDTVKKKP